MYEQAKIWSKGVRLGIEMIFLFLSNKCVFCDKRLIWIDRVHTVQAFETVSILATVQNEAYGTLYFQKLSFFFYLTN